MPLYLSRVKISNIRCFEKLNINFRKKDDLILWTTLLGDNATGKTTLLKCIALGLCDESSAAGLLKESEEGYIRKDEEWATISIELCYSKGSNKTYRINTRIEKIRMKGKEKQTFEKLRQRTIPFKNFPWHDIFVCAYGIGRGISGTGDISGYYPISAVYNLFNYFEGLQNPELILRRIDKKTTVKRILKEVSEKAMRAAGIDPISMAGAKEGLKVSGQWESEFPLRDVADGVRSFLQWIIDFIGWALSYDKKIDRLKMIHGIVIVDALEEHLHPVWQRYVVSDLKKAFPNVQFVISSHSPLVAAGSSDFEDALLVNLVLELGNKVVRKYINLKSLHNLRPDQILRIAFGLPVIISPKSPDRISRFIELATKKKPSPSEKKQLATLKQSIKSTFEFEHTNYEQQVYNALNIVLKKILKEEPSEIHKLIEQKTLYKLFRGGD